MPHEDHTAWTTVLAFITDYRPDCVIQLGHLMNLPPFRRPLGQATIELRRRELTHTADYVRHNYLSRLRNIYSGPLRIICSAASAHLAAALQRKTVPDSSTPATCVESLVQLNAAEGVELSTVYTLAPSWMVLYGDHVAVAPSDVPGGSAVKIAKHLRASVIVGHTMRLGKGTYTVTRTDDVAHTLTGVEIGNLIDQRHMEKMNGRGHGWQQGFVIIETDGSSVSAECIPLSTGRAAVRWTSHPQTDDATGQEIHPQPVG